MRADLPPARILAQLKSAASATICDEVAVTDGDKVAAQIKFGFSVNTGGRRSGAGGEFWRRRRYQRSD